MFGYAGFCRGSWVPHAESLQEFVLLRKNYMVDGCPYFTTQYFSRTAGVSLSIYRKGDMIRLIPKGEEYVYNKGVCKGSR